MVFYAYTKDASKSIITYSDKIATTGETQIRLIFL